ncbi:MAG: hypothetical protein HC897_11825 [Thermoanaerobaculia bacterium]|nr:hypothetical protein [Thermoanaerobaculia bacterium]
MTCKQARVFLDTTALLMAFGAGLKKVPPPTFLTDPTAERITFEKCIYEVFMAFRGIGGKKPSEGRQDWAKRYLQADTDPHAVDRLANKFHDGRMSPAHFWVNFIGEAAADLGGYERAIHERVRHEDREAALAEHAILMALAEEKRKFERLCDEFLEMLKQHEVRTLGYAQVFSGEAYDLETIGCHPQMLSRLFRATTIPSEDFEIVYAAIRGRADLLITGDGELHKCSFSLGLNLPLSPAAFCKPSEYEGKLAAWRRHERFAEFR